MTYKEYKELAKEVTNYKEADELIKKVADDETISALQYANIRHWAITAAYEN